MASYASETAADLDADYKKFFEDFYRLSDTTPADGGTSEAYADQFTDDAALIMGSSRSKGRQEIIKLRNGMWDNVATRKHTPRKIYSLGPRSNEVMLYGEADFTMKDGSSARKEWGARAVLIKEGGKVKMGFYQVYLT